MLDPRRIVILKLKVLLSYAFIVHKIFGMFLEEYAPKKRIVMRNTYVETAVSIEDFSGKLTASKALVGVTPITLIFQVMILICSI